MQPYRDHHHSARTKRKRRWGASAQRCVSRPSRKRVLLRQIRRPLPRLDFQCRKSHLQKPGVSQHFCDTLIGYARVSTDDQHLRLQRAALKAAGCRRLYEEKISGAKRDRPELARMLDALREGDVIVVSRRDRLARSTRDLLDIAELLNEAGSGLRSLAEPWADTTSPAGRMILTVFADIAEFERS